MNLTTKLAGHVLQTPLLPASGPLTGNAEKILALSKYKLGAIVTKTISSQLPQIARPFISGSRNVIMNCEPWSEYSVQTWKEEFFPQIKEKERQPLFVSIGYTDSDMQYLIPQFDDFADAYEISTHYVGKDLRPIKETIKKIRQLTDKPVYMKISPHFPDPISFAHLILEEGANGIVVMNSLGPALEVDLKTRSTLQGNIDGQNWLSGPVIKPIALALVSLIKRAVPECEIIGVGGVETAEDVLEFLLCGASAVEMLSSALLKGMDQYKKIIDELPRALEKYHFQSIQEVIDCPLSIGPLDYGSKTARVKAEDCSYCEKCVKVCPFFAIQIEEKRIFIDSKRCMGCGLCRSLCPKKAIIGV